MKRTIIAALALVALASCAKENSEANQTSDQVEATFTAAAITRVTDNAWEATDKIGITMTVSGKTDLADGDYYNVLHNVDAAGTSGSFSPDSEVIYFPVDGSAVDFYAYYPYATPDADDNLDVNVATQTFSDIDIVAAKATAKTKSAPTVAFSGDNAFGHCLSKLTITLKAGEGITSLENVTTTIKGQYTTAKYNLYTSEISSRGDVKDITAVTTGTTVEAILIPTSAMDGSTIVFTLDGDNYVWDTSKILLAQGSEHTYEITITKTGIIVTGALINDWGSGSNGSGTAE